MKQQWCCPLRGERNNPNNPERLEAAQGKSALTCSAVQLLQMMSKILSSNPRSFSRAAMICGMVLLSRENRCASSLVAWDQAGVGGVAREQGEGSGASKGDEDMTYAAVAGRL